MQLAEFKKMVDQHDLTYDYSDDYRVSRRGQAAFDEIKEASKQFPKETVEKIWNDMVDRKLAAPYRAGFYWRG